MGGSSKVIGFANLTENQEFTRTVREGLEIAAASYDGIELVVRNNDESNDMAQANIDEFMDIPVDLAIIYHIDERFNQTLNQRLMFRKSPVIAVDIPIPLATYFGANNRQAGELAGREAGIWVNQNWDGHIDKVLVVTDHRVLAAVKQRFTYAVSELANHVDFDPSEDVFYIDGDNGRGFSYERTLSVLDRWQDYHNIVIFGLNDESALGAVEAARDLGREQDVIGLGHGATLIEEAYEVPDTRFIGSVAYYPEYYGDHLLSLADRILSGDRISNENFIEHRVISSRFPVAEDH